MNLEEEKQSEGKLSQEESSSHATSGSRQFDFWIGEWDLTWPDEGCGTNSVQAILDGKVILETFSAAPSAPLQGMSVSVYNPSLNIWQQTWVDNQGTYLDFVGASQEGRMILERTAIVGEKSTLQRMVFYNITPLQLDWSWEHSQDHGVTWEALWQIHYRRK